MEEEAMSEQLVSANCDGPAKTTQPDFSESPDKCAQDIPVNVSQNQSTSKMKPSPVKVLRPKKKVEPEELISKLKLMKEDANKKFLEKQEAKKQLRRESNKERKLVKDQQDESKAGSSGTVTSRKSEETLKQDHTKAKVNYLNRKDRSHVRRKCSTEEKPNSQAENNPKKNQTDNNETLKKKRKKTTAAKKITVNEKLLREKRESCAKRVRQCRANIRADPVKYEEAKKKERERSQSRREEGKIKSINDLTDRQKRNQRKVWREKDHKSQENKKKLKKIDDYIRDNSPPPSEAGDMNENAALADIEAPPPLQVPPQRGRLLRKTRQKQRRQLAKEKESKDNLRTSRDKLKKRYQRLKETIETTSPGKGVRKTMQQGSEAVKKKLLWAAVLEKSLSPPSPKKSKLSDQLTEKSDETPSEGGQSSAGNTRKTVIRRLLPNRKDLSKYNLSSNVKDLVGVQYISKFSKKRENEYERKTDAELFKAKRKEKIAFLEEDAHSFFAPGKKDCITRKGVKRQKRYLSNSLCELHKEYNSKTDEKISLSFFSACKPFWIVKRKMTERDTCLCMVHENFKLMFEKLKQNNIFEYTRPSHLVQSLCCDFSKKECMCRECNDCKERKLVYQTDIESKDNNPTFFYKWVKCKEKRSKGGKEYTVSVTKKVKVETNIKELKQQFEAQIEQYMQHSYRVSHQLAFSRDITKQLENDEAFLVMDFSENFQLKYSSEIQSCHFGASNNQLTLHTGAYYIKADKVAADDPNFKIQSF